MTPFDVSLAVGQVLSQRPVAAISNKPTAVCLLSLRYNSELCKNSLDVPLWAICSMAIRAVLFHFSATKYSFGANYISHYVSTGIIIQPIQNMTREDVNQSRM